ncbi:MAG: chromosome partitioning protein ParB [Bacteroidetes bacterium]|nr:MAG: chromosome partitioning protein ParB [Bacteroidota bacterium]
MAGKKPALGKGIDAILPGLPADDSIDSLEKAAQEINASPAEASAPQKSPPKKEMGVSEVEVDLNLIDINPNNPREDFDEEALAELAESIQSYGVIQSLTVRRVGERYELVAGERRLRASKLAGLDTVPVHIVEGDDAKTREMALVENIQREDLNAIEIALGFQDLMEVCHLSQEQLADRVGKKRSTVTNYLRLMRLPISIQASIRSRKISMGHARALLTLEDASQQEAIAAQIVEHGLSVRAVEQLVKELVASRDEEGKQKEGVAKRTDQQVADHVLAMQKELNELLGWGVQVKSGSNGSGRVVISYRTEGERRELMEKLQRLK